MLSVDDDDDGGGGDGGDDGDWADLPMPRPSHRGQDSTLCQSGLCQSGLCLRIQLY